MWYAIVEQQREWMRAWHAAAQYARHACDVWPAPPLAHAASSCYADLFEPLLGLAEAPPPFAIRSIALGGRHCDVDEHIVAHTPFCDLRCFSRARATRAVLLCTPLAGHAAVMMRETVEALLADGDVYLTDWINARDVPLAAGRFGLDEYVAMLDAFIDRLAGDKRPLHIVAVCQSTFPALGALALRAQRGCAPSASITLIGGPLDTRINPSTLGLAAESHSLDWCQRHLIDTVPAGFAGQGRHVFPTYLQRAEIAVVYPHRYVALVDRYAQATSRGDTSALAEARRALIEYTALLDMPAEYFLDTVDIVFQNAMLARRAWRVSGKLVDPAALRDVELLSVEGTRDAVTGAGQTHAALEMCSGIAAAARQRLDVEGCDHYGLFTGERWRNDVHPALQAAFGRAEAARLAAAVRSA
ncbi:polyhydroxyalkanoate depolymerase [Paraburkholderia silvatlantica]|uniref:Polyhydroxyalkanoate depolymerase n=1 Tax=Paraburkholderia silvatlantica TaxID=321895 RepID=A0A2V4U2X4_9BURK|nr:polyhydroxyalkanoate depolymerase [Paraburkholderia silvatlantica]PYE14914.1 polyhydroxyalkanoate depolymerase [Paraburkholderia silvatlantica]TDR04770.1 polyhydroxyalkanoate depolymerase [Paraburkholderia silvatlantica]